MKFSIRKIIFIAATGFIASCTPQKKLVYFQGQVPSLKESAYKLKIYPGDILSIYIFAINAEAFPFLPQPGEKSVSDSRSSYERGYVVSETGEVKMPLIGIVNFNGLTIREAADLVELKFKAYMEDPIVAIRKLNFKVTVLGEVNKPGTYPIFNERATLPEVLGLAGDLTGFGNRTNVKIIREENNDSKQFTLDLTSANALSAETYFLHPDDIIYVEPTRKRAFQNVSPTVTVFTSIITTAVLVFTFIITNNNK
ncbi:polysaccharide biosynthesis/export family protein [soil metagenome]